MHTTYDVNLYDSREIIPFVSLQMGIQAQWL